MKDSVQSERSVYWILFVILIVFNFLLIGYSHVLLTEAVMPGIVMFTTYMAYKWNDVSIHKSKLKGALYGIFFILISILAWFIKQPYFPIIIFLLSLVTILNFIQKRNWKILLEKIIIIFMIIVCLVISIKIWGNYIGDKTSRKDGAKEASESYLAGGIINGVSITYRPVLLDNWCASGLNGYNLTASEKNGIAAIKKKYGNDWCNHVRLFNVHGVDGIFLRHTIIIINGKMFSTFDSLSFLLKNTINAPRLTLYSYVIKYLNTVDVQVYEGSYHDFGLTDGENRGLGLAIYDNGLAKCWWQTTESYDPKIITDIHMQQISVMEDFEGKINYNNDLEMIIKSLYQLYLVLFKVLFVLAPFITIYGLIKFIRNNKNMIYFMITLLFGTAFLHALFHAATGATIDRYMMPAYPLVLLGVVLLFMKKKYIYDSEVEFVKKEIVNELNKESVKTLEIKGKRILFVIPAHNESKNIEKVIKDIHKNAKGSDIVVINDCSSDSTKEIVEKNNVYCLDMPFNVGYAMALQTGIQYAYKNDYDYMIQFDGDGQHLASEASKILEKAIKTKANIVIGSRFLKKTDYKHPFGRMMGTKLFSFIIKVLCKKKITDPTSGFQCLDRKVIERYAIKDYPEFPDANLIIEMLYEGYKIEEESVIMKESNTGVSMHGGIYKPLKYMIKIMYAIMFIIIIRLFKRGEK